MSSKKLSVSVVIPNFNGGKLLAKHLPAVINAVGSSEILVVDDASNDRSVQLLKDNFPQIKVITHSINKRFAAACNTGFENASGEIVILLNNDVSPQSDFLANLLKNFEEEKVFAVGCAEKISHNSQDISGKSCATFSRGIVAHRRCERQEFGNTLWVSGGSGAFRKSIWNELKGMDTMFAPAYQEDRDISYRAMKRGYKVLFEPNSVVIHHHETTNKQELGASKMLVTSFKNQFLFIWKNITSTKLILKHLVWLPYQLIVGGIKSKGLLIQGFVQALKNTPDVFVKRQIESKESLVTDEEIFAKA